MPLTTPTYAQLVDRISADLATRLPTRDPYAAGTVGYVMARVLAGPSYATYQLLAWAYQQWWPQTTTSLEVLDRWGSLFAGLVRATADGATGDVDFNATGAATIPSGTVIQRSDGTLYQTTAPVSIGAPGTLTAPVQAQTGGVDTNASAGATMTLASPIANVDSAGVVAAGGLTGGTDDETLEEFRGRILTAARAASQGGTIADYETWTLAALSAADFAFVSPHTPADGDVEILFTVDGGGGSSGRLPSAGQISTVQSYIDNRAPATDTPTVAAPGESAATVAVTISSYTGTPGDVIAAVEAQLEALWRNAAPGDLLTFAQISAAISAAPGEISHVITLINGVAPTPATNVLIPAGDIGYVTATVTT